MLPICSKGLITGHLKLFCERVNKREHIPNNSSTKHLCWDSGRMATRLGLTAGQQNLKCSVPWYDWGCKRSHSYENRWSCPLCALCFGDTLWPVTHLLQPPEYSLGFHTGRPDTHNFFQNAKRPEFVYPGITKDAKTQIKEPDYTSFHQICLLIYLFVS